MTNLTLWNKSLDRILSTPNCFLYAKHGSTVQRWLVRTVYKPCRLSDFINYFTSLIIDMNCLQLRSHIFKLSTTEEVMFNLVNNNSNSSKHICGRSVGLIPIVVMLQLYKNGYTEKV